MTVQKDVREFIVAELRWTGSPDQLTDSAPLIENDVIDSLGVLEIVSFLEDTYDIEILDDELIAGNFETLNAIAGFVRSKQR